MASLDLCKDQRREAQSLFQSGDIPSAIEMLSQAISSLVESGVIAGQASRDERNLLAECGRELVDLLRWEAKYDEAIDLQERLSQLLPERTVSLRASIASLRIESGDERTGLAELCQIVDADPDNVWASMMLGTSYLWLMRSGEAEKQLRWVTQMGEASERERALAYKYLFSLYDIQGRVYEAVDTWERGSQLDPDLGMMLPDVCRMFAYWQYFDSAREYLARERFDLRLRFYTALIAFKEGLIPEAEETWTRIVEYDYDHRALTDGFDEFAEACVRLTRPGLALEVLAPLMRDQDIDYYRLLLAGLAWAQQRAIRHAKETLDIALRVAELGRPRRTRPGGKTRILDARSRILYGEVTIDADVRQELDQYFIPGKA